MTLPDLLVTFSPAPPEREAILAVLEELADVTFLPDVPVPDRAQALASAHVVLAGNLNRDVPDPGAVSGLKSAKLLQVISAGVDQVPFGLLPPNLPIASNAGAYAAPMAEHVVAMALALAKHLPQRHAELGRGVFDRSSPNRQIHGSTVGFLGFGGIARATAKLFRAFGSRVYAINRSPVPADLAAWSGTLDALDFLLAQADILVVSIPLTRATRGLIGKRELSIMKQEAILVNVARAAIIDEDALYEHLRDHPGFSVGLDVWWQEPGQDGPFVTRKPFFELPNVLGSPHNSGMTENTGEAAARAAALNIARFLEGGEVHHLVDRADYLERPS